MTVQESFDHLVETVRGYNPSANFDLIRSAFEFADKAHEGQLRKDNSPFVTHPLAVAQIVAEELHLDSESIAAALLHDTIEDTAATHEQIAELFSPTIANLVEGVRPDSIVIPMQCVMRDAKGNASVWVIDAENKIATRKITASRSIGTSWLVESGLKAGDRVVFEGFQRTRAGATVSPKEADASKMLDKTGKSLY